MFISNRSGFQPAGVIFCAFFTFAAIACAGTYSGGSGTAEDPYKISTVADWQELIGASGDWDKHFILINDIDFGGINLTPVAPDTSPSGIFDGTPFSGVIDGRGYSIRNVVINLPGSDYVGLIGFASGLSTIQNLRLENIQITGANLVGGLAGQAGAILNNCHVTGTVSGNEIVGGLVGKYYGNFMDPAPTHYGSLTSCSTAVTVNGSDNIGGLVGNNYNTILIFCSATGNVNGTVEAGGLLGFTERSNILNCYATGTINGSDILGGLVGTNWSSLKWCYSTGKVLGSGSNVGGLVGSQWSDHDLSCFWDMDSSGQNSSASGEGRTTAEMKALSTFTSAGWDFVYSDGNAPVWKMAAGGYPALFWEYRYSGGTGTAEDPYRISTAEDLIALGLNTEDYGKSFVLTADIDLTGQAFTMAPIAADTGGIGGESFEGTPFTGTLDGRGFEIRNLTITDELGQDFLGLFGYTIGATIRDLRLENFNIKAVGHDLQSVCRGGLVGLQVGGEIRNCRVESRIEGGRYGVGGMVGHLTSGTIRNCHCTTEIRIGQWGSADIGGLVGYAEGGTILSCSSEGALVQGTNNTNMGGLVGLIVDGNTVRNCFSRCSISGDDNLGGLVGNQFGTTSVIENCYSCGAVYGHEDIGGLVGKNAGTVKDSFWDRSASGRSSSAGGTAKWTFELTSKATFTAAGWDFVGETTNGTADIWRLCEYGVDYPRLAWEYGPDLDCPDGVGLEDLLYLSGRWLEAGVESYTSADRTGDGRVDLEDLSLLSDRWLENRGPITLKVYSDGWGTLIGTFTALDEGAHKLRITDERPYHYPPEYFVYISREEFYTEQYRCKASKTPELPVNDYWITVDVDLEPVKPAVCNGTIFLTQYYFASSPLNKIQVTVRQEGTTALDFQTDSLGRFSADLVPGAYSFEFSVPGDSVPYVEPVVISGAYQDILIPNHVMMVKPNIYLYPESVLDLRVWISFPYGGAVATSIPQYSDGWAITADPSGLIDGNYGYLFYESSQGDRGQYERGWVIERENLGGFFRENMEATGFNEREISDFLSYWIPRLEEFPVYAIYPQYNTELARMNELHFSVRPDSVVRLLYAIRGLETGDFVLPTPEIPRIEQRGFVVREWGVMLK